MNHKLLIATTDPTLTSWPSLMWKLHSIRLALGKTKNGTWLVPDVRTVNVTPEVRDGKITHAWFDRFALPYVKEGYQHIFLHFSEARWRGLGLTKSVRARNQRDADVIGDCYGRADENSERRGLDQLVQIVLHELSHELAHGTGTKDRTHTYHKRHKDISGIFSSYDMNDWHPKYQALLKDLSAKQKHHDIVTTTR